MSYEDSASALHAAYIQHRNEILEKISEDKYEENMKALARLKVKEQKEGKF